MSCVLVHRAVKQLINVEDPVNICDLVFGYISEYVTFLQPVKGKARNNWNIYSAWSLFLGDVSTLKLVTDPKELSFERTKT
ncbi:replication initiation factor domain-containing protein [Liquorilactobacillus oeni]|uniref:Replication initiation protein-like C-terminal domain-containing protein n=1 Tax=Liquorilactobacillus oeni DSM 19972 TaxID=1423777 RepID=A0A0R1MKE0_9LACO|nr:replication initiation factor domain-containing protein [Liquorilactobacillus oeni]KRL04392.1 hypothetical protein FD46_GL001520 [Liquorilactobacillus oeni DSM 19972]